jgi:hypothetical protein
MNLVFVAEVRDGCSVDQMASQNGHFLIRRVLISGLGHDENLLSNYSLLEKAVSPLSLGAKHLAMMFKLAESASKTWKRLKGYDKLEFVAKGCTFKDGELQQDAA